MEEINKNIGNINNNDVKKKSNVLGIISLILGILSLLTSCIIFISAIFAIASLITGIIALFTNKNKAMPIIGVIISVIAIVISIIVSVVVKNVVNDVKENVNDYVESNIGEDLKEGLTTLYNDLSEGITEDLNVTDKLKGYSWKMGDGSLLVLKNDGTYYWYKDANDKTDNYYYGKYKTLLGDKAIEEINEKFGFNEEGLKNNTKVLRTDIYFLRLDKEEMVINGKKSTVSRNTYYALFFYDMSSSEAVGMNLTTQNTVSLKKVN